MRKKAKVLKFVVSEDRRNLLNLIADSASCGIIFDMLQCFKQLKIVTFESRRAPEVKALILKYQGVPLIAPSMAEIPLEENYAAFQLADKMFAGEIDILILTTGIGTEILLKALETKYQCEEIKKALQNMTLIARGPKPLAALAKIQIKPHIAVAEPNTWHEIIAALNERNLIKNRRIAIQEYGVPNHSFIDALTEKGAHVFRVPVYRWSLPEDLNPLKHAIHEIAAGNTDIIVFMSAQQIHHVLKVARMIDWENQLLDGIRKSVVASVGPLTSEALKQNQIAVDFEPSKARMAVMIHELAQNAENLLKKKRSV